MTSTAPIDFTEFLWIWHHVSHQTTPPPQRRMARWLEARWRRGDRRLLLMAFRGSGKSTLVGLFCAWRLAVAPDTRILVVAADQALAVKMVAQVRRILERHPLCAGLRPPQPEAWAMDRFTVAREASLRDPSMLAQGVGGNITGARADLLICDDIEVAGNCDTPTKREALRACLAETEFVLVPGGSSIMIGTPHCAESLYLPPGHPQATLLGYRRLRLPLLDATGDSVWPERFDAATIEALRQRVGPLAFRRQMLLELVEDAAVRLDPALLLRYREEPLYREANGRGELRLFERRLVSGGGYWDPAFGKPGLGDASVLACLYADAEGNLYLHRLAYLTHDPDTELDPASQQCREVARIAGALMLPAVRVESNGLGRFLPATLRREMAMAQVPCAVIEHTSTRNKTERILGALDPALAGRRLHVHDSAFRTSFPAEMAAWRPHVPGQRDDALDALAGAIAAEPVRLPSLPPAARGLVWRGV
jgi:hypothetical protein